jgi:hypothetical protein
MHDDLAFRAADDVLFFPREIVMVFQIEPQLGAEVFRDALVDADMVDRGVSPHQFHRVPVFLSFL